MIDPEELEKQTTDLIGSGNYREAERTLLLAYAELKTAGNMKDLDYVVFQLAMFYSLPEVEDLAKAEEYLREAETLSPGAEAKRQTAWFYFYTVGDFPETIKKVDEIAALKDADGIGDYYSGLAVKGHALLNLGRVDEAGQVLNELLTMIKANPPRFPFGDEMNFLEAAVSQAALAPLVREILVLIIPRIRSQEYVKRGEVLLELT